MNLLAPRVLGCGALYIPVPSLPNIGQTGSYWAGRAFELPWDWYWAWPAQTSSDCLLSSELLENEGLPDLHQAKQRLRAEPWLLITEGQRFAS